jgi:murein DD-endopeptidase MepM/ murein hydrolase activator NlpD
MRPWLCLVLFLGNLDIAACCLADTEVRLDHSLMPGDVMIGKAPVGSTVRIDDREVRQSEDGLFVFGAGRDAKGSILVVVDAPDGSRTTREVEIIKRDYAVQRIDGLAPRTVEPNPEDQKRIEADWVVLSRAKDVDSAEPGFKDKAVWPVTGPISGVFGSQRILNGKPKSPHRGVDVAAPTGTPVTAMLGGLVAVADNDMYYTGGTVMIDHGHGLTSLYAHLSEISVEVGQRLEQGEGLGRIGATGRVTGPHLHLSLYWFDTALDPALLLGPMPAATQ